MARQPPLVKLNSTSRGTTGSSPLLNVYEEPHDGDFDFVKGCYPYRVHFAATNFRGNGEWLGSDIRAPILKFKSIKL